MTIFSRHRKGVTVLAVNPFLIENLVVGEKQVSLRLGLLGGWLVRYRDNEVGLVLCYPFEM